jgi:uncharacterized membrane protein YgdD (TMEM256/DUF423 family)
MRQWWIIVAAVNGILAVGAGTISAHLLAAAPHRAHLLATGAQYAMYHALALLALSALASATPAPFLAAAGWLFVAGTILFSGSLYFLGLSGIVAFAWVTPFGGSAFLLGWAALAFHGWGLRRGG